MFASSPFPIKAQQKPSNKSPNIRGPAIYGTERGKVAFFGHYLGTIKDVFDPTFMGIIRVYIPEICGNEPQDEARWINCRYASPFFNQTPPADKNIPQKSSGFWGTPVDVNQAVIVIFIQGDINSGYYIASVPEAYQNRDIAGGAINIQDEKDPLMHANPPRVGRVYAAADSGGLDQFREYDLVNAGLAVDTGRAPPSGPSMNSPSSTVVLRSPGNKTLPNVTDPAINGKGYIETNYKDVKYFDGQIPNGPGNKPTTTQRTGGHIIRLEDDISYEHIGIISRSGHQIIMNDTKGCIYINTHAGNNWIELTKDGKIDIYARDSVSIRTQADFNFYADRDFNVHAGRHINLVADEGLVTNSRSMDSHVKEDYKITVKQNMHIRTFEDYTLESKSFSLKSIQDSFIDTLPANLFINCGKARTAATVTMHKFTPTLGGPESFMKRIPMPEPWPDHETKFDNDWKSDNDKRIKTSPPFTDINSNFKKGSV